MKNKYDFSPNAILVRTDSSDLCVANALTDTLDLVRIRPSSSTHLNGGYYIAEGASLKVILRPLYEKDGWYITVECKSGADKEAFKKERYEVFCEIVKKFGRFNYNCKIVNIFLPAGMYAPVLLEETQVFLD